MKQLLGFLALLIIFSFCGASYNNETKNETKINIPKNWKLLDKKDYSIQYPDSFSLDQSGKMGSSFILFSKQASQQDLFRENINLTIENLSKHDINLDQYVELSEKKIKQMITEDNIISKRLKCNNKEFHQIIYKAKLGQFNLKWQQFCWVINKKAYILTFTSETKQYNKYKLVAEKILKSFKIK